MPPRHDDFAKLPMTIPAHPVLTRRKLLLGAGTLLAGGCAQTPSLSLVRDSFSAAFPDSSAYPRTREQVDGLPYAQLGVRVGSGGRGIMVLNQQVERDLYWVSANRMLLVTRGGRVVRSVGLPTDLLSARAQGPDLLELYQPERPAIDGLETTQSIDTGTTYGVILKSRYQVEGSETIQILGQSYDTLRVREDVRSDLWRWSASNTHWLSKRSPLIWRSRQHLMPGQPALELELLKRPA